MVLWSSIAFPKHQNNMWNTHLVSFDYIIVMHHHTTFSGWALCGHGAAPGEAPDESTLGRSALDKVGGNAEDEHATTCSTSGLQGTCDAPDPGNIPIRDSYTSDAKDASMSSSCAAKRRGRRRSRRKGGLPVDHVLQDIPRARRMEVGAKCKRLIDEGRLEFLKSSGFKAESLLYVRPEVSGENRLLLASCLGKESNSCKG